MRTSIRIAALVLGGLMFVGCDKKDNTTVTTPPPATPPAMPDTSKATDAVKSAADTAKTDMQNGMDAAKTGVQNATDAAKTGVQNATDAAKAEKDKLMSTTMPSMPGMPK